MPNNQKSRRCADALERRGIEATPELLLDIQTTREAARYTRLSQPTLERFRLTGEGPAYLKLGGAVRYRRSDLDAWLDSCRLRSTSEGGAR